MVLGVHEMNRGASLRYLHHAGISALGHIHLWLRRLHSFGPVSGRHASQHVLDIDAKRSSLSQKLSTKPTLTKFV
jgi:hypothetical protein